MSHPSLPPYLGSWDELVQTLLHNPYLGSGREGPTNTEAEIRKNGTQAITFSPAVSLFVSGIGIKEIASKISDTKLKNELNQAADQAIADWQDDYCGTPPHPNPRAFVLAAELVAFATSLQEGNLQTEVFRVASQVVQKSLVTQAATKRAAAATR